MKLTKVLSGVAGEYFVAAELSRQGYIATLTLRNTRGIDILVANADTSKSVGIQVKTNQGSARDWMLNKKVEGNVSRDFFYVFVNLNGESAQPTYHIVPSRRVASYCQKEHGKWLSTLGRKGHVRKDNPMRKFRDKEGKYIDAWKSLGL